MYLVRFMMAAIQQHHEDGANVTATKKKKAFEKLFFGTSLFMSPYRPLVQRNVTALHDP